MPPNKIIKKYRSINKGQSMTRIEAELARGDEAFKITPIQYANRNNDISPRRLEELLEDLADMGYLTAEGQKFKFRFWEMFIKK